MNALLSAVSTKFSTPNAFNHKNVFVKMLRFDKEMEKGKRK